MGSTFTVRLPLTSATGVRQTADAPRIASQCAGRQRVLIVDDNTDAAETLRMLLTTIGGGDVQTASSGVEALKLGAQLRPNVVLLDLGMPGMDGYEVARRMRGESWGKDALLVALTGWGQDQYRRRSSEAGFDRHMTKPADPEALRAVLSRVPVH
jgi:CheY-like chemotaxis protein